MSKKDITVAKAKGRPMLPAPKAGTTVAVKIIDMLGEECLIGTTV